MENQPKKLRLEDIKVESFVTDTKSERMLKGRNGSVGGWVCADLPGDWPDPDDFCSNGWGSVIGSPCDPTHPTNQRDTALPPINVGTGPTNAVPCYPIPGGGGGGGTTALFYYCCPIPYAQ